MRHVMFKVGNVWRDGVQTGKHRGTTEIKTDDGITVRMKNKNVFIKPTVKCVQPCRALKCGDKINPVRITHAHFALTRECGEETTNIDVCDYCRRNINPIYRKIARAIVNTTVASPEAIASAAVPQIAALLTARLLSSDGKTVDEISREIQLNERSIIRIVERLNKT